MSPKWIKGDYLMNYLSGLFGTFWPWRPEDDLLPRESGFQEQNQLRWGEGLHRIQAPSRQLQHPTLSLTAIGSLLSLGKVLLN